MVWRDLGLNAVQTQVDFTGITAAGSKRESPLLHHCCCWCHCLLIFSLLPPPQCRKPRSNVEKSLTSVSNWQLLLFCQSAANNDWCIVAGSRWEHCLSVSLLVTLSARTTNRLSRSLCPTVCLSVYWQVPVKQIRSGFAELALSSSSQLVVIR